MNEYTDETNHWSRDTQKLAVLTWISFLTAAGFTMMFFAFIDPLVVVDALNIVANKHDAVRLNWADTSFQPAAILPHFAAEKSPSIR